jgi:hypothetical protein
MVCEQERREREPVEDVAGGDLLPDARPREPLDSLRLVTVDRRADALGGTGAKRMERLVAEPVRRILDAERLELAARPPARLLQAFAGRSAGRCLP